MESGNHIKCPNCGENIDVQDVLVQQVKDEYKEKINRDFKNLKEKYEEEKQREEQEHQKTLLKIQNDFNLREKSLFEKEQDLLKARSEIDKQIQERLKLEEEKQLSAIRKKVEEENEAKIKFLEQANEEGKMKAKLLQTAEWDKLNLQKQINEMQEAKELEFAKRMEERLKQEAENISKKANENSELKLKEKDLKIEELARQINDLQRRAEQGSMQLQGEAQEIAVEETLKSLFPYDSISEVGKGVKGGDIIQVVRNQFGQECGKILYESKRTKHFGTEWIDKLKQDSIGVKADFCVIISEAMPEEIEKIGIIKGVWICSYQDYKGLAVVLRESLLRIAQAYSSQANKGEKMQMLYDYLTSQEFVQQFMAVMKGYQEMKAGYEAERNWFERNWKKREKQLDMILLNANGLIGSLQGIAGSAMPEIQLLGNIESLTEGGTEE